MQADINGDSAGRSLRILIVEDSKGDIRLVLEAVKDGRFEVIHEVVDSSSAMRAALANENWELITSDQTLPRFSGRAVLAMTLELNHNVAIANVSDKDHIDVVVELIKGGAVVNVQKPELVRLVPVIDRLLHDIEARDLRDK
jgi:DNA-binding NtrC family response regulator